jgi:hypothetical protein
MQTIYDSSISHKALILPAAAFFREVIPMVGKRFMYLYFCALFSRQTSPWTGTILELITLATITTENIFQIGELNQSWNVKIFPNSIQ